MRSTYHNTAEAVMHAPLPHSAACTEGLLQVTQCFLTLLLWFCTVQDASVSEVLALYGPQ